VGAGPLRRAEITSGGAATGSRTGGGAGGAIGTRGADTSGGGGTAAGGCVMTEEGATNGCDGGDRGGVAIGCCATRGATTGAAGGLCGGAGAGGVGGVSVLCGAAGRMGLRKSGMARPRGRPAGGLIGTNVGWLVETDVCPLPGTIGGNGAAPIGGSLLAGGLGWLAGAAETGTKPFPLAPQRGQAKSIASTCPLHTLQRYIGIAQSFRRRSFTLRTRSPWYRPCCRRGARSSHERPPPPRRVHRPRDGRRRTARPAEPVESSFAAPATPRGE
jgi:hypothetical protein